MTYEALDSADGNTHRALPAFTQTHGEKERKEDIRRHRAMAAAHEAAAKCLESGKPETTAWRSCARIAKASESANTVDFGTSTDLPIT